MKDSPGSISRNMETQNVRKQDFSLQTARNFNLLSSYFVTGAAIPMLNRYVLNVALSSLSTELDFANRLEIVSARVTISAAFSINP